MALEATPVYRNLATRVTFLGLEAEDLFAILALAVVSNILGRFLQREMFGIPMNMVIQYLVPVLSIPGLMLFKYGKQRGYLKDWVMFHSKPHVYSALERDSALRSSYIRSEE
jgi:hypothetical protein